MKNSMLFRKIGGSRQLVLDKAENLEQILQLDEAYWAVNAMPVEAAVTDPEFLTFLDADANKRNRPAELKDAIAWLISILRDYQGIDAGSDILALDALNTELPEGKDLHAAAKLVLDNLAAEDKAHLSLAQIRDKKSIIAANAGFIEDVRAGFFGFGEQLLAVLGEQGFICGDNRFSAFQSFENNRFCECGSADEFNNDFAGFDRFHRVSRQDFLRDFDAAVAHDIEIGDFPDDRFHTGTFRNNFTVFNKTVGNAGAHGSESNNSNSKLLHGELLFRLVLYDNCLI